MIHYAEIFGVIKVRGGQFTNTDEVRILCGAESGEADTRKGKVTCPDCHKLLWPPYGFNPKPELVIRVKKDRS